VRHLAPPLGAKQESGQLASAGCATALVVGGKTLQRLEHQPVAALALQGDPALEGRAIARGEAIEEGATVEGGSPGDILQGVVIASGVPHHASEASDIEGMIAPGVELDRLAGNQQVRGLGLPVGVGRS